MQNENKEIVINNNGIENIEEFLPKKQKVINAFLFLIPFSLFCGVSFLYVYLMADFLLKFEFSFDSIIGFIIGSFYAIGFILITFIISEKGFKSLTNTVAISSKGIRYTTMSIKIDCDWEDVIKIEVETHKNISIQTGLVISSTTNYIIHTSKGTFSLKEGSAWNWNARNLREVYDNIISHAPDAEIIQKEVESKVDESQQAGK